MLTQTKKQAEGSQPSISPIKLLSVDGHREPLHNAGFTDVQVVEERAKGWICATGRKA